MQRRDILKAGAVGAAAMLFPKIVTAQCDPTTADIEGPFYTPNAPTRNVIKPAAVFATTLFLTGTVYYRDCDVPVANAQLDVWQADENGEYDNIGFNYRGKFTADDMGNYSLETIIPGKYLNGSQYRPRHIHLKINVPGRPALTTQLYFEGDEHIPVDPWASEAEEGRVIPLTTGTDGFVHGVFNISLRDAAPTTSVDHSQFRGEARIVAINPQPLGAEGLLLLELKHAAQVDLRVFDVNGQRRAQVHSAWFDAGQHEIRLNNRDANGLKLNAGVYILQAAFNGTVVDAKRFLIN